LKIIKYIRKHKDRNKIIGIDNDTIDRDYDMYKIVMKNYKPLNINFLWAHNSHITDLPLSDDNLKYIKNKNHKWFLGHYYMHSKY
jgi:erythromycin esterase-like protein